MDLEIIKKLNSRYSLGLTRNDDSIRDYSSISLYNEYSIEEGKIVGISICDKEITPEIMNIIYKLENLIYIKFNDTGLSEIPDNFHHKNNVLIFDLSFNKITAIPKELYSLNKLSELILAYNEITSIPTESSYYQNESSPIPEPIVLNIDNNPVTKNLETYGCDPIKQFEIINSNNKKTLDLFTEGKTDALHIKNYIDNGGCNMIFNVNFMIKEGVEMGDKKLEDLLESYKNTNQDRKKVFMFDRDSRKIIKKYGKDEFTNHGNNVYSFCIPKLDDFTDFICIEHYYKKSDLKTMDKSGRRLFLGREFYASGNSRCGKYQTFKKDKCNKDTIIDEYVYKESDKECKDSIALSKNKFANNILKKKENFSNFDLSNFKLILDLLKKIYVLPNNSTNV